MKSAAALTLETSRNGSRNYRVSSDFESKAMKTSLLILVFGITAHAGNLHRNGKIAFTSDRDGNREIYVMNADGTNQTRLTNNAIVDDYPAWSPNGTKIAFASQKPSGDYAIFRMDADGTNRVEITPLQTDPGFPSI